MKYRTLKLTFSIEDIEFTVLSICLERLSTPMPMHSHSKNSYEIHYISYGYGTLHLKDKTYEITPGTLFVTGPEIEHEQISVPDNPMTEYCIYVKVNIPEKRKTSGNTMMDLFIKQSFWFGMGDNTIHELMKQILYELETQNRGYDMILQALLQQFILQLTRKYETAVAPLANNSSPINSANDLTYLIIEEAFLYDYKNITLEKLADQVSLGKRQTERLLQMHYRKTFLQKKTEARMSAACSLLRDTKQSISDIADKLGYSSVEHFSNAFKRYYKQTPSDYRRSCRQ